MKQINAKIISNRKLTDTVNEIVLEGDFEQSYPGQFLMANIPSLFLNRPFSILNQVDNRIYLLVKSVGRGSKILNSNSLKELEVLTPLGHGFPLDKIENNVTLIGGGCGIAPLFYLANFLKKENCNFNVLLGFNSSSEMFYYDEFNKLTSNVYCSTMDGSFQSKGIYKEAIKDNNLIVDQLITCGPYIMMKKIQEEYKKGFMSLECRMGCGYGICNGCTIPNKDNKPLKVCVDGPVFNLNEVIL